MATRSRAKCTQPFALRNVFVLLATGALAVAGFVRTAGAQTAEQTSTGMQISIPPNANPQDPVPLSDEDQMQEQLLAQAMKMIKSGRPDEAITGPITRVIARITRTDRAGSRASAITARAINWNPSFISPVQPRISGARSSCRRPGPTRTSRKAAR